MKLTTHKELLSHTQETIQTSKILQKKLLDELITLIGYRRKYAIGSFYTYTSSFTQISPRESVNNAEKC